MKELSELTNERNEACDKIIELLDELEKIKKEGKDITKTIEQLEVLLDRNMELRKAINNIIKIRL